MSVDFLAFEPGATVWVGDSDPPSTMKMAALFEVEKGQSLFALLWAPDVIRSAGSKVYVTSNRYRQIGQLDDPVEVFGSKTSIHKLFHVLAFDANAAEQLRQVTMPAAFSENMVRNAFLPHKMKARIPQMLAAIKPGGRNSNRTKPGRTGYVVGDVTNAVVKSSNSVTTVEYANLVSKGKRRLAEPGDGGLPVLSSTNALVGFVIGSDTDHTLVIPAERIIDEHRVTFRTFPGGIIEGRAKVREKPMVKKWVRRPGVTEK